MATYLTAEELERVERMAGEAHKPTNMRMLTEEDFDAHAKQARVKDAAGLAPVAEDGTDPQTDYVNTVDLYRAASYSWNQKASVYAEQYEFEADGGVFKRNQGYDMCVKQSARYADMSQANGTNIVPVPRPPETALPMEEWLD